MPSQTDRRARLAGPMEFASRVINKLNSLWISYAYPFASVGVKLSTHCTAEIARRVAHRIQLGNFVSLNKHVWLNVSAVEDDGEPVMILDDGCVIGHRTTISAKNCIHLERDVITAQSVLIMDHSHAYEDVNLPIKRQGVSDGGRIRVGQGCWIGHGAVIVCTKGELTLGENCVVAANALVTTSFPPYSVISGNPARVVKQFDPARKTWVLGSKRFADSDLAKGELVTR